MEEDKNKTLIYAFKEKKSGGLVPFGVCFFLYNSRENFDYWEFFFRLIDCEVSLY